jgi:hypothetical protein
MELGAPAGMGSAAAAPVPAAPPPTALEGPPSTLRTPVRRDQPAPAERPARGATTRIESLGPYRVEAEIARGGTAVVYRARHVTLGKPVAIKVLLPGLEGAREMGRRLLREALALARFRHPHIVPVLDAGTTPDGSPYLVMEFVEGEDLAQRVKRTGPLEWREALGILTQVTEAVDFAHARGVIHRDLKPANVLLDTQGRAQLVDFGLARDEAALSRLTQSGTALGTPAYMPPEQARGEREGVTRRSDLYSLGAILYEMLTARAPFQGGAVMEVLYKVVHQDPEPLRRLAPGVPPEVEAVCEKALQKDPARRYASAYQLLQDLRACLAGQTPPVARPRRAPALRRVMRRAGVWSAAALLLMLTGAGWLAAHRAKMDRCAQLQREGEALLEAGRCAQAEEKFSEYQNLDPGSAAAFLGRREARRRLAEAEQTRAAAERDRRDVMMDRFRSLLAGLGPEDLPQSIRSGTDSLVQLVADMLSGPQQTRAPAAGTVRLELDSPAPGAAFAILPLEDGPAVCEGSLPGVADLAPGLYRLRYRAAGAPEKEFLLPLPAGRAWRLALAPGQ